MRVVKIDQLIGEIRGLETSAWLTEGGGIDEESVVRREGMIDAVVTQLEKCDELCRHIGLPLSRLHIRELLGLLGRTSVITGHRFVTEKPGPQIARGAAIVASSIEKEMSLMTFFTVPYEKTKFLQAFTAEPGGVELDPLEPLWSPVFAKFPSTAYDAKEAFKCFALGRNTASVFHLMRVLELGLTALGKAFSVSLAHTNWQPAIDQIESAVRGMHKDPIWKVQPDCKEQQEFYSQAVSHFGVLKDAWRNYTAHVRGKYDEQEAADIMTSVRAFMQKLSTRLAE